MGNDTLPLGFFRFVNFLRSKINGLKTGQILSIKSSFPKHVGNIFVSQNSDCRLLSTKDPKEGSVTRQEAESLMMLFRSGATVYVKCKSMKDTYTIETACKMGKSYRVKDIKSTGKDIDQDTFFDPAFLLENSELYVSYIDFELDPDKTNLRIIEGGVH